MSHPVSHSHDAFLAAFLDARLAPADLTHREHLRATWLLLQRMPVDLAVGQACAAIAELARRYGVPDKFHQTLTEVFVRLVASRPPAHSWEDFLAANSDLLLDGRRVLAQYYSDELIESRAAKESFLPPDRAPLP